MPGRPGCQDVHKSSTYRIQNVDVQEIINFQICKTSPAFQGVVLRNSGFQIVAKSLTSISEKKFWIFSYTQKIEPGEDKEWTRGGGSRERWKTKGFRLKNL